MENLKNIRFSKDAYSVGETIELTVEYEGECEDIVFGFGPDVNSSLFNSYAITLIEQDKPGKHAPENTTYHLQADISEKTIKGHCRFLYAIIKKGEKEVVIYKAEGCEIVPMILTLMLGKEASKRAFESAPIMEGVPTFDVVE